MGKPFQSRHRAIGLAAMVLIGTSAIAALRLNDGPSSSPRPVAPSVKAADISGRKAACLAGSTDDVAASADSETIWSAMQQAAVGKPLNVQRFVVPLPSANQAGPYLAGLVSQHCDLIIAVGSSFTDAIPTVAKSSPRTQFLALPGPGQAAPSPSSAVTGSSTEKTDTVRRHVLALVNS